MPLKTKSAPKEHLGLTTRQKMKKYRAFYIMFIPLFLCLILFSYLPMFGILYAFTDYTPFKPAQFVGLQNFQKLFSQAGFWKAFFNTLQISITKLVIDTLGSIVLALLLDELHFKWFKKISQTIIYIAALSGVDMEQHEAAVLDGATRFQRVIYLTLPAISGTIVTVFILNLAKVLNLFDPVWVLQNSMVINTSDVLETYVYRMGISGSQYGLSTAAGLFKSVISILLVAIGNKLSKKLTGEEVL